MKFKLALLAVVSVALLAASAASALITAPPPGTWKSMTQCLTTGSIALSSGQYLRIGWGSLTEAQAYNFLQRQTGFVNIRDASFSLAASFSVGAVNTYWTQPTRVVTPGSNGGRPFWLTAAFFRISLAPGTYTISSDMSITQGTVNDGSTVFHTGDSWFSVGVGGVPACTLVVT